MVAMARRHTVKENSWQQSPWFQNSECPRPGTRQDLTEPTAVTTVFGVGVTAEQANEIYASVPTAIEDGIVVAYPANPEQVGALYAKVSDIAAQNGDAESAERLANLAGFSRVPTRLLAQSRAEYPASSTSSQQLSRWVQGPWDSTWSAQTVPAQQPIQMPSQLDLLRRENVVPADLAAVLTLEEQAHLEWLRGLIPGPSFKAEVERLRGAHRRPTILERLGKWWDRVTWAVTSPSATPISLLSQPPQLEVDLSPVHCTEPKGSYNGMPCENPMIEYMKDMSEAQRMKVLHPDVW